jgi:hypothetical protein
MPTVVAIHSAEAGVSMATSTGPSAAGRAMPQPSGQAVDLGIDCRTQLPPAHLGQRVGRHRRPVVAHWHHRTGSLSQPEGGSQGHPVEPRGEAAVTADGPGGTGQGEKGGLEYVVGVRGVAHHAACRSEYQARVSANQSSKGGLVAVGDEPGEQGPIRLGVGFGPGEQMTDAVNWVPAVQSHDSLWRRPFSE